MSISIADRELVEGFWREYVDGYIFNDLENSIRFGHANYLVALGEMCYIDFFGKLMTGVQGSPTNFRTFVQTYLKLYATDPLNPSDTTFLDSLYGEFRSGLVHSYFPKNVEVVAVAKAATGGPSIWRESGKWKIAVADFLAELKAAVSELKEDVLSGTYLAQFINAVSDTPGLDKITAWPPAGEVGVASTTVTVVSGSVVFPPASSPSKPPSP